jgi:hypothetical protein
MKDNRFARRVFTWAGLYGIAALVPMYLLEERLAAMFPPALTHPEFFYGFAGVALAWQIAFLMIGSDPVRFRPLMLAGVLEKLGYGVAVLVLVAQERTPVAMAGSAVIDLVLAALFMAAYLRTRAVSASGLRF